MFCKVYYSQIEVDIVSRTEKNFFQSNFQQDTVNWKFDSSRETEKSNPESVFFLGREEHIQSNKVLNRTIWSID